MGPEGENRNRIVVAGLVLAAGLHLLAGLAGGGGDARAWGVSYLTYLSPTFRWGVLLLPFLLALGAFLPRSADPATSRSARPAQRVLDHLLPVVLLAPLFGVFRDATHLLGDGRLILAETSLGKPISDTAPLANRIVLWTAGPGGTGAGSPSRVQVEHDLSRLAVLAGIVFILLSVLLWRRALSDHGWRARGALALFLLQPYLLWFFGYVEFYPLAAVGCVSVSLLGLLAVRGRVPAFVPIAVWIVSLGLHTFLLALAPLAFAGLARSRSRSGGLQAGLGVLLGAGALAVLGSFPLGFAQRLAGSSERGTLLPLRVDDPLRQAYGLFDAAHALDLVNALALGAPLLPLVPIWLLAVSRKGAREDRFLIPLGVSATLSLGAAFLIHPQLGMARDWDLMALAFLPVSLFAVHLGFAHVAQPSWRLGGRPALLATMLMLFLIGVGAGRTAAWVAVQFDPVAAARRGSAIAREGSLNAPFARSHFQRDLCLVYGELGQREESLEAALEAYALRPEHAELAYNVATIAVRLERFEQARGYFQRAVEIDPDYAEAYDGLGVTNLYLGDREAGEEALRRAVALDPRDMVARANLVRFYTQEGRLDDALGLAREMRGQALDARKTAPIASLARALEAAGRTREAAEVEALLPAGTR